tara:strand:- start:188 stop:508 length:321 start_codon:yes stop_codon:yes gene_type:complete
MSRTIWKYDLGNRISSEHDLPIDAEFRHAGLDPEGKLCVWMEVDNESTDMERHTFAVFNTGQVIPDGFTFWGSIQVGTFMLHVHHYNKVEPIIVDELGLDEPGAGE